MIHQIRARLCYNVLATFLAYLLGVPFRWWGA
nr:MAG TPA: hypothetical protein [Caudoviricetes sp.]